MGYPPVVVALAVYVCLCNSVTESDIRQAVAAGCGGMTELTMRTGCGSTCGSCVPDACELLEEARARLASLPEADDGVVAFPGIQHAA
jgi:bacterioferritin-associated ferredoxin